MKKLTLVRILTVFIVTSAVILSYSSTVQGTPLFFDFLKRTFGGKGKAPKPASNQRPQGSAWATGGQYQKEKKFPWDIWGRMPMTMHGGSRSTEPAHGACNCPWTLKVTCTCLYDCSINKLRRFRFDSSVDSSMYFSYLKGDVTDERFKRMDYNNVTLQVSDIFLFGNFLVNSYWS